MERKDFHEAPHLKESEIHFDERETVLTGRKQIGIDAVATVIEELREQAEDIHQEIREDGYRGLDDRNINDFADSKVLSYKLMPHVAGPTDEETHSFFLANETESGDEATPSFTDNEADEFLASLETDTP